MNILVDNLPNAVEIDGCDYLIDTDFRAGLRTIMAFEDPELVDAEKQMILIDNLYPEPPDNTLKALEQGVKFLNGGEETEERVLGPRVYAFQKDAKFILAAFQQTHGINLIENCMHWWRFLALFMDLGGDTTFSSIIGLRRRLKDGSASKEDRKLAREMHDIVELSELDTRTPREREIAQEFENAYKKGQEK